MVNSTTPLLVPHADSSETGSTGLRLRDVGSEDGLHPSFADLFSRTRAEQSAPPPASVSSRASEKLHAHDENAPSVEDTALPETASVAEPARESDSDKAEPTTGKEEKIHEEDKTPDPQPTPRAALPIDLPPMMTVAVVKAIATVATTAPAAPTTATPTIATPVSPVVANAGTSAASSAPLTTAVNLTQATTAPAAPNLAQTVAPAIPTLTAGENAVPPAALPYTNTGQSQKPATTPNTLSPIPSDFPGVPMDSNALAAVAAPASGVEFALPPTVGTVANAAPAPSVSPLAANATNTGAKTALSQTSVAAAPVVQATPTAPAAKASAPAALPVPTQGNAPQQQAQSAANPAAPILAETAPTVANGPAPTTAGAASIPAKTEATPTAAPRVSVASSDGKSQTVSAPKTDTSETNSAEPISLPLARVVSSRPNSVGIAPTSAFGPQSAFASGLPPAIATAQATGVATPFGSVIAGQTETASTAMANPIALATTSVVAADAHAVAKTVAPNAASEHAAPTPAGNALNTVSAASGGQSETGAGAQNGGDRNNSGSAAARNGGTESVSGANKTGNAASVNSYAAVADKTTNQANAVAAPDAPRTANVERQERARLVAQVTKHLESLRVHDTGGEMALRLRPDHLGSLRVSIATGSDGVVARIVAEHTGVQQALESAKNELRQALESKGLHLDRLEVTVQQNSADGRSAFGNAGENAQNAGYRSAPRGLPRVAGAPDAIASASALSSRLTDHNALLDRVA